MPTRERRLGPRPPSMWLTWWMPEGTVVEHNGRRWEKVLIGAADATWYEWRLVKLTPMPRTGPKGPSATINVKGGRS